jgi:hypothetical protein
MHIISTVCLAIGAILAVLTLFAVKDCSRPTPPPEVERNKYGYPKVKK